METAVVFIKPCSDFHPTIGLASNKVIDVNLQKRGRFVLTPERLPGRKGVDEALRRSAYRRRSVIGMGRR